MDRPRWRRGRRRPRRGRSRATAEAAGAEAEAAASPASTGSAARARSVEGRSYRDPRKPTQDQADDDRDFHDRGDQERPRRDADEEVLLGERAAEEEGVRPVEDGVRADEDEGRPDGAGADRDDDPGNDPGQDEEGDDPGRRIGPPRRVRRDRHRQPAVQRRDHGRLGEDRRNVPRVGPEGARDVGREEDPANEQDEDRDEDQDEDGEHEPEQSAEGVVGPAQGTGEVQGEHAMALVAPEQLGRLGRAEQEDDRGDRAEVFVEADQVGVVELAIEAEPGGDRQAADDDHGRQDRHRPEDERRRLRPAAPADPVRRPEAVHEQGPDRVGAPEPGPLVAPIAEVVDIAGASDRRQGAHRADAGGPSSVGRAVAAAATAAAAGWSRNRSSSRWRRCSIRTSARPSSTTVSRTMSKGASSTRSTRMAGPSTATRRPRAVSRSTRASRPSSTSTASVPVRSVNEPSGADRSSLPFSIATRWSQTRSISPSRCEATITAIPNSLPVRRISSSISSRPAGSRPFVGSSRRRSRGSWTSAWASLTRCFIPVE